MLLNVTNHPSDFWPQHQRVDACRLYGRIMDMPFPPIPADAGSNEIKRMASEFAERILRLISREDKNATVHLMGEQTFTYSLVGKLKSSGIRVVASTTERKTTGDHSEFKFVRFREY